jgi:hypothetical protein
VPPNEKLLDEFREKVRCEVCLKGALCGCDPHHVFSRGAGRADIRENLLAVCRVCHTKIHAGNIKRADLMKIIAHREGKSVDELQQAVYDARRNKRQANTRRGGSDTQDRNHRGQREKEQADVLQGREAQADAECFDGRF